MGILYTYAYCSTSYKSTKIYNNKINLLYNNLNKLNNQSIILAPNKP